MTTRYFGERIKRNEDPRLLTGQGLYVDDVDLPDMLHAAFVRSPYAHARITSIDASRALQRPGVVAAYTAADLGDYWKPGPLLVSPPPVEGITFNERTQVPLARDKVRFAGEPLVLVLAESRYIAEDALADIEVGYEPFEAVGDLKKALQPESPLVHEDVGSNVAAHVVQRKGDYEAAKSEAALVIGREFRYEHGCAAAIENRGIVAQWDRRSGRLTVWDTTQAPVVIRNGLADMLGLSERQVRVIAPFIGGGFGPKIMMFYQEEVLVPWAAMRHGRPVKWIEDRAENFVATTHERGQIHAAEIALVQARLGLEQSREAQAHRHHQQSETERDAQHVRNDRSEPEVRGRSGHHDDVRPRRQRHDGGEQEQRAEQDAFVHGAHHSRNGGDESGGKSWRESPRSLR
jgi:CO/xanthine dehydrogenase Mo-binding subunit